VFKCYSINSLQFITFSTLGTLSGLLTLQYTRMYPSHVVKTGYSFKIHSKVTNDLFVDKKLDFGM